MCDTSEVQAVQFGSWLTIDEIGYGAANGGGEGEAVTGEAEGEGQTFERGSRADERDAVDALRFEASP